MNIEILEKDKGTMKLKMDNVTVAEILRRYLNEVGVEFAAWKREHPTKPVILEIESGKGTPQAMIKKAIEAASKDLDLVLKDAK